MAVNVLSVRVLNNPAQFTDPLAFEIEYEALCNLEHDLAWKLVYVGCAYNSNHDQELENVEVGPVTAGKFKFVLEANPPNPALIPADDLVGVTVILLTCSYKEKEFIQVGYYLDNEYVDEELRENPPEQPLINQLQRNILADHPRVTRHVVPFDEPEPMEFEAQPMNEDGQEAMQQGGGITVPQPGHFHEGQPPMFDGAAQQQVFNSVPVQ